MWNDETADGTQVMYIGLGSGVLMRRILGGFGPDVRVRDWSLIACYQNPRRPCTEQDATQIAHVVLRGF